MAEFGLEDYQNSVVRIFDAKDNVVGAGFLAESGYVLTCAHVVLQASGTGKEKFEAITSAPAGSIKLDFPIWASGEFIYAEVVDWLPYNLTTGDVALLKLLADEPESAKPMPLKSLTQETAGGQAVSAYGFGDSDGGGRTDAYKTKTKTEGNRWMLCKSGDPTDETIQPGYSGAPVWCGALQAVIGMVAAAKEFNSDKKKSKAYVVSVETLQAVLKTCVALSLDDLLSDCLARCAEEEKFKFSAVSISVLKICNPEGDDQSRKEQLQALNQDRIAPVGWDFEGALMRFAVMLAHCDETPPHAYQALRDWVNHQGFSFSELLDRLTYEMKQRNIPSGNCCEHLMIVIEPDELEPVQLRLSMWLIADRQAYKPTCPLAPVIFNERLPKKDLAAYIHTTIRNEFGKQVPMIHLFGPRNFFCEGLDMLPSRRRATLGSTYPFVMRTNLNLHPIDTYCQQDWIEKWNELEDAWQQASSDVFIPVKLPQKSDDWFECLEDKKAVILEDCDAVSVVLEEVAEEFSLPVVLWVRDQSLQGRVSDVLTDIFGEFPEKIRVTRESAYQSAKGGENSEDFDVEMSLGHHLTVVWEDVKVIPPGMLPNNQFDQ